MSRVAKAPVTLPQGVTATISAQAVTIKGSKGSLSLALKGGVTVEQAEKALNVRYGSDDAIRMQAGATRAHLANMVEGVSRGFERKLELQGVGYRAQAQGALRALHRHAVGGDRGADALGQIYRFLCDSRHD